MMHPRSGGTLAPVLLAALGLAPCAQLAAQQQFDTLPREHVPFLQAGALAPVVADFDGDGLDDLFYGGQVRTLFLRSATPGVFAEASGRLPQRNGLRDRAAAAFDYDRDGDLDLVLGVAGRENRLFRNDGAAGFVDVTATQPWSTFATAPTTNALAVGDVTGDGIDDLVFGDDELEDRVFHGQANGVFTLCATCQPGRLPRTAATLLEDFDGDGDLDLFRLANLNASVGVGQLEVNDGRGNWTLRSGAVPNLGFQTRGAVAIDVDQDGDLDVLAYGSRPGTVLFENRGGGTFAVIGTPTPTAVDVRSLTVADRDGDGLDDLLLTAGSGTQLLQGTTGTVFRPFPGVELPDPRLPTFAGGFVDADSDGDLDVVAFTGQIELWLDESGRFSRATAAELTTNRGPVAVGDLDGDGDPDVLVASTSDPQRVGQVLVNDGDGRFVQGAPLPTTVSPVRAGLYAVKLADLNGDGALDALVGQTGAQPVLLLGNGDATFRSAAPSSLPTISTTQTAFALGDADGDGDLDLAIAGNGLGGNAPGAALLLNDGTATFRDAAPGSLPALAELAGDLEFADVDADGDLDLLICTQNRQVGTQLRDWRNDGSGRFIAPAAQPPGTPGYDTSVTVADFDADGDLDVATGFALLANDGTGTFTDVTASRTDAALGVAPAFVDIDEDGDLDLLTIDTAFRQDAQGVFRADASLFGDRPPRVYATADLDADGDPDLVGSFSLQRNLAREISIPQLPRVGGRLRVAVDSRHDPQPRAVLGLVWIGAERLAQPVDVPGLGLWRLDPNQVVDVLPVLLPAPGRAELVVPVPNQATLAGADVHTQALVVLGAFPDWRLTRAETVTIQR